MEDIRLILTIIISVIAIITSIITFLKHHQTKGKKEVLDITEHEKLWKELTNVKDNCQENKKLQDITNSRLYELDHEIKSTKYEFKIIEAKLEGISALILTLQGEFSKKAERDNEVTKHLIDTIKDIGKERRRNATSE